MILIGPDKVRFTNAITNGRRLDAASKSSSHINARPAEEIAQALKHCKVAAIMDRCESYNGHGGPLASEVPAALFREKVMIEAVSYIYGLAGRDFTVSDVKDIFAELEGVATEGKEVEQHRYIRLR